MASTSERKFHRLEKLVRGFSNHRRIEIMYLLDERPDLSLVEISDTLGVNFKTISEHTCRLVHAGLVAKKADGSYIRHTRPTIGRLFDMPATSRNPVGTDVPQAWLHHKSIAISPSNGL